jgi:RimJ/RimL family protein N-acetyltransferase
MAKIQQVEYSIDNKKFILRHAEVEDAEKLIELMRKLDVETTFLLREADEFTLTIDQEKEFIKKQQDSEVNLLILVEVDGKVIGSCGINGNTRKRLRHSANLGIAILREYWGMGIGKKLIETGIKWTKENDMSRITLQVDTNNYRAISLYLKLGFEIEGTLKNDKILSDGSYRNTYTMALL